MAWTDGVDYSTGQLISATIWNNYLGAAGDIDLTAPGVVTTAGDLVYATADNTLARLASSGGGDKFLQMNSGATAPAWVTALTSLVADTSPQLGGFLDTNGNYIQMEKGGDIASASPTVPTTGDYFDVTGTTTIAAWVVAADRHFFTQFDAALQLTHNATDLDLPGEANITTAAGDVAEWVTTGTNDAQCVNYTKADGTAVAGGGKILQIVNSSNSTEATSTSSSYANTAHTVTITPAGTGSKILVGVSFSGGIERSSTTEANGLYKLRNTTDSADLVEAVYQVNAASGNLGMFSAQTLMGVDTGRADATVYYLQYKSDGTSEIYVNNSNDPGQMWAIEFSS